MIIFNQKLMSPMERKRLEKLDNLVLNASSSELKKIQEIDHQTQMEGLSFYDVYLDSSSLIHQSIKKPFRES
ncbi:hypothetical protein NADRNF5_0841 [Nitrosopumilus adriaticus]|uniref:Uncharacterized protein n=2 Tax=Nitrosopumilus adriaticus TaxID=1580092 RepID=A0A0D5C2I0_9ARCH|nr:hypothetical protein NADRNF5_0841 [Nitrosopumilus adriaticus]